MSEQLRLVWALPHDNTSERVDSHYDAARLVVRRERFEGRRLEDEEYNLLRVVDGDSEAVAYIWTDGTHATIHGYVENERIGWREIHDAVRRRR